VNIQQIRVDLAAVLDGIKPEGWQVTTETAPDIHTGLIQVGHATTITPLTYRADIAEIAVTLWVNEADATIGVESLYALLSPGEGSIRHTFRDTMTVPGTERMIRVGPIVAGNVGPRDEGPTGYLAGDVVIPVRVDE
jgi:hypothetical protein